MLEYLKSLFKNLPVGIRGGIWMIIAGIFFTFIGVMIRMANKEVHILEIVFFRYLISLIIMIPWMARRGLHGLKGKNLPILFARSLSSYIGAIFWFASMIMVFFGDPDSPVYMSWFEPLGFIQIFSIFK